jgi:hypothetical protein
MGVGRGKIVLLVLSTADVVPQTLHKWFKLLNVKDDIFSNIQRAAVFGT